MPQDEPLEQGKAVVEQKPQRPDQNEEAIDLRRLVLALGPHDQAADTGNEGQHLDQQRDDDRERYRHPHAEQESGESSGDDDLGDGRRRAEPKGTADIDQARMDQTRCGSAIEQDGPGRRPCDHEQLEVLAIAEQEDGHRHDDRRRQRAAELQKRPERAARMTGYPDQHADMPPATAAAPNP